MVALQGNCRQSALESEPPQPFDQNFWLVPVTESGLVAVYICTMLYQGLLSPVSCNRGGSASFELHCAQACRTIIAAMLPDQSILKVACLSTFEPSFSAIYK